MKFVVNQGIVHVNSIQTLQYTKNALVFYVDFKQKYPEFDFFDDEFGFGFGAGPNTLNVKNKNLHTTLIKVVNLPTNWIKPISSVSMGRYSATVFLVQKSIQQKKLPYWSDNQ